MQSAATCPDAESIITRFNAELRSMIADRTYHRLLHVDWIRADLDGDGVAEYVPKSERAGPRRPQHAYDLFVTTDPQKPQPFSPNQRILIGGSVYDGWTTVPDRYKVEDPKRPDPNKATAGIFPFRLVTAAGWHRRRSQRVTTGETRRNGRTDGDAGDGSGSPQRLSTGMPRRRRGSWGQTPQRFKTPWDSRGLDLCGVCPATRRLSAGDMPV